METGEGIAKWLVSDAPIAGYLSLGKESNLGVFSAAEPDALLSSRLSRRPLVSIWPTLASDWDYILIDSPCILSHWRLNLALPKNAPLILTANFRTTKMDTLHYVKSRARWQIDGVVLTEAPSNLKS